MGKARETDVCDDFKRNKTKISSESENRRNVRSRKRLNCRLGERKVLLRWRNSQVLQREHRAKCQRRNRSSW